MSISGLQQAADKLDAIAAWGVRQAKVMAVNRVAGRIVSRSLHQAAKDITAGDNQRRGIPYRTISKRARLRQASLARPKANIFVNLKPLPAIRLLAAQPVTPFRAQPGQPLRIGPYKFNGAFVAKAPNGYMQVFRRTGKPRLPLTVLRVPVGEALRRIFTQQATLQMQQEMPKEFSAALNYQLQRYKV